MTIKTKRILVPVGFSEQSLAALDQAIIVAKAIDAEIVLLAVAESNTFWQKLFNKDVNEEELKDDIMKKLLEVAAKYENSSVRIEPMVAKGTVYEEIARVAEMILPELVIMGTNGRPENFLKKRIGSNAYNVARLVKDPVIIVKGVKNFTDINSIVFPIVLDRKSKEKVGECLHWARIFGATVNVVAVSKDKDEYKKLVPHVTQVTDFINKHGVKATAEIIRSEGRSVPQATLDYADQINADLLIIMDDGDEVFRVFSTEVEEVIYNADLPVMCVTPSPSKYSAGFQSI